ncbi:MAG: hypothetical protein IKQ35_04120 [Bacilli bacterium]|nr:hypothetical protein [Bacilli bacterium]
MSGYYYHGVEAYYGTLGYSANLIVKMLEEGIIVRSTARGFEDEELRHVCLYKKNEEYDYSSPDASLESARGGWIDGQFVLIINPEIKARKATSNETNLVDEWRCDSNIPPTDIVGIALPFKYIEEYLDEESLDEEEEKDHELLRTSIKRIREIAKALNIEIYDSEEKDFTDKIDATLSNQKQQ